MQFDARTDQKKIADLQQDVALLTKLVAEQQEQIGSLQQGYLDIVAAMKKLANPPRQNNVIALPVGVSTQRKSDG